MIIYAGLTAWILLMNLLCRPIIWMDEIGVKHRYTTRLHVFLTMGMIVFVLGMRSGVADTGQYITTFNEALPVGAGSLSSLADYSGKGPLYRALAIICKSISRDYHFYLLVVAAFSGFVVAGVLRKNSDYYSDEIVLFMLTGSFTWMINGIRQFLAVSVVFLGTFFLVRRKPVAYAILVLIAACIHRSAIIMLPVYFIVQGKAWNARTMLFILLGVLAVSYLSVFTNLLDLAIEGTEYEGYTEEFDVTKGSNPIRTVIYAIPPVLAFFRRRWIDRIAPPIINISINMSIIAATVSLIANFTNGILVGAIPIYFSLYNLVLLPWLVKKAYPDMRQGLSFLMYSGYTAYFFLVDRYPYYSDKLFGGKWYL